MSKVKGFFNNLMILLETHWYKLRALLVIIKQYMTENVL